MNEFKRKPAPTRTKKGFNAVNHSRIALLGGAKGQGPIQTNPLGAFWRFNNRAIDDRPTDTPTDTPTDRPTNRPAGTSNRSTDLRECTAQVPFPESAPHSHLTWRQEEENHGVSERLITARSRTAAQ